jgi:hypothetical protein
MSDRRQFLALSMLSALGIQGCGGGAGDNDPPPAPSPSPGPTSADRATGWTQMPVGTYTALPPIGGAVAYDGGFPAFDLSDTSFMASIGFPVQLPAPGDQGSQGSCTAWAVGYAAATQTISASTATLPAAISPSDVFTKLRNRLEPNACTQGSQINYAMDVLVQEGATTLDVAPYSATQCGVLVPGRAYNLDGFSRVDASDNVSIRGAVQSGQPVSFGIMVDASFRALNVSNSVWTPSGAGGGHALSIIGYDDRRQLYKIINSWGQTWGQRGFFYLSYADFARFASDVCIPFLRRPAQNALLSSTSSNPGSSIQVQHMYARPYGGGGPGSYGVGVEIAWSQPLAVTAASISALDQNQTMVFDRSFTVSQIARGLRFGGSVPDSVASLYLFVRSSITGRDSTGAVHTLSGLTKPQRR